MTTPNAALAYQALDAARTHRRLDMGTWADGDVSAVGLAELTATESCGTTACLAGWIAVLAGYKVTFGGSVYDAAGEPVGHIQKVAAGLLGITLEQSEDLFFVHDGVVDEKVAEIFGPRPAANA